MKCCVCVCVFEVICHGPPVGKVKREHSPLKELSPCRTPQADMCLYSYRYELIHQPLDKNYLNITWSYSSRPQWGLKTALRRFSSSALQCLWQQAERTQSSASWPLWVRTSRTAALATSHPAAEQQLPHRHPGPPQPPTCQSEPAICSAPPTHQLPPCTFQHRTEVGSHQSF